jgi:hypothetical protein
MADKKGGGSMPKQTGASQKGAAVPGKDTAPAKPAPKGGKK